MKHFAISGEPLSPDTLREALEDPSSGGYVSFEGWVRNHADGHGVHRLEYEVYETLAQAEGERILDEAVEKFGVTRVGCVHRKGTLEIGHLAVWVGVSAAHRDEAFKACRYIIDEVKARLPIWKKEQYASGDSGWVNCEIGATNAAEPAT